MAKQINIEVKESLEHLRYLKSKQKTEARINKIKSLILIINKEVIYTKDIAKRINYSRQTVSTWIKLYRQGGIDKLLSGNYAKRLERKLSKEVEEAITKKLTDTRTTITSYVELLDWVQNEFDSEITYSTLYYHCRKHQNSTLKVARKSHHKKDELAEGLFKKPI